MFSSFRMTPVPPADNSHTGPLIHDRCVLSEQTVSSCPEETLLKDGEGLAIAAS